MSLEWLYGYCAVSTVQILKNPKSGETEPPGHAHGTTNEISIFGLDSKHHLRVYTLYSIFFTKNLPKKNPGKSETNIGISLQARFCHLFTSSKSQCSNTGEKRGKIDISINIP